tara:strand:- start:1015 stop:1245 length:231 start_codon:yes stop_codon:yes gene_type:complete
MEPIIDIISIEDTLKNDYEIIKIIESDNHKIKKRRERNCIAARKYRKKKEDLIKSLKIENEKLKSEIKILKGRLYS